MRSENLLGIIRQALQRRDVLAHLCRGHAVEGVVGEGLGEVVLVGVGAGEHVVEHIAGIGEVLHDVARGGRIAVKRLVWGSKPWLMTIPLPALCWTAEVGRNRVAADKRRHIIRRWRTILGVGAVTRWLSKSVR
jgi:hypothetical protein